MPKASPSIASEFPIERVARSNRRQRYPFASLKPPVKRRGADVEYDSFFVPHPEKEKTLRSQASRRGKALKRQFSVNRDTAVPEGGTAPVEGLRILRIK